MTCSYRVRSSFFYLAFGALVAGCGGGGGGGGGFPFPVAGVPAPAPPDSGTPTPAPAPAPEELPACLAMPGEGMEVAVSVSTTLGIPLPLGVATLTNEGPKAFEGQSFPSLSVRSVFERMAGRESRHSLHMLADAPLLPVGATTYSADDVWGNRRYAYTYANLTLAQLSAKIKDGTASFSWGTLGSEPNWEWLSGLTTWGNNTYILPDGARSEMLNNYGGMSIPDLTPAMPSLSIFNADAPTTLLMLERRARGSSPFPTNFRTGVKELTLTNAGREDVKVGEITYAKACKVNIVVRRADMYIYSAKPETLETRTASAWFGPSGLVKVELNAKAP